MEEKPQQGVQIVSLTEEEQKLLEGLLEREIQKGNDYSDPAYMLMCDIQAKIIRME